MLNTFGNSLLSPVSHALWYVGPQQAEIRSTELDPLVAGELRIQSLFSGISRGTESLVWQGLVPESEYDKMRAPFMAGTFPFPVKYGYANVGIVQAGPEALLGQIVFGLMPHQTLSQVASDAVVIVPKGVTPQRAVLAANMETALNAVWDASPGPGDRIAIIGGGVVGCLVAYLCSHLPAAQVTLVDILPTRASIAQSFNIQFAHPSEAPKDCDLVIHTSASAAGLATAIDCAGEEATVLELSWYGSQSVEVPLGGGFHSRQIRLQSSQVGHISPARRPRWTYRRRLLAALAILTDDHLDQLLSAEIKFHDLPKQLPAILGKQSNALCSLIKYP